MTYASDEYVAAVRARIIELTGKDPGPIEIRNVYLGDPEQATHDSVEEMAQSIIALNDDTSD